ncbi:GTPase IMAP family member 4-like [Epinephelus fuscoguttatus]|uniref:GTPase IMAP family member 4-like n=1 Tax=Epinephelus fuscoguttatus TaxID=293821 RepID=UPI0020CFFCC6|nr:GTPase IMAP family member 4-like [Epinephelus fuscoguttatus]
MLSCMRTATTSAHELNIMLLGGTDTERTLLGNFITGQKAFHDSVLFSDKQCKLAIAEWSGMSLTVVKTPDIFDLPLLSVTQEMTRCMTLLKPGPTVMLLIVTPSDFTEAKRQALKATLSMFGQDAYKYSMVILGKNEEEKNASVDKVIQDCDQRHHTINLDKKHLPNNRLQEFMEKIGDMLNDNRGECVTLTERSEPCAGAQCRKAYGKQLLCDKNEATGSSSVHEKLKMFSKLTEHLYLNMGINAFSYTETKMKSTIKELNRKLEEYENKFKNDQVRRDLEKERQTAMEERMKKHEEEKREIAEKLNDFMKKTTTFADLVEKYVDAKQTLTQQHNERLELLKKEHEKLKADLEQEKGVKQQLEHIIKALMQENENKLQDLKQENENKLQNLKQENENKLQDLKEEHGDKIKDLKQEHEEKIKDLKQEHEDKVKDLKQWQSDNKGSFCDLMILLKLLLRDLDCKIKSPFSITDKIKQEGDEKITSLKQECDEKLKNAEREHQEQIKNIKEGHAKKR